MGPIGSAEPFVRAQVLGIRTLWENPHPIFYSKIYNRLSYSGLSRLHLPMSFQTINTSLAETTTIIASTPTHMLVVEKQDMFAK